MVTAGAGVRIRDYAPADLERCLRIFDSNVPAFFTPAERADFEAFLRALPGPYLVLEGEDGEIAGCGGYAVVPEEGRADLCWGMIRQDLHGTGLGRVLTEARLARARSDPAVRVVALDTSQHTRGFYERFGFRTVSVTPNGYGPGLHRCDMRLVLARPGGRS